MTEHSNSNALDIAFQVPFVHRLRMTDDVLGADWRVLADVLRPGGDGPARIQFWLDQCVMEANPGLLEKLQQFPDYAPSQMELASNVQVVPGGEAIKNDIHIIERMLKCMNSAGLDRRSYVVVVGGGAVLDAVGFATAIAHRGLRLVRLPTTTLGQADSGVGVKNGINLFQKKNWLGSFAVPWAVINDAVLLSSLPDRDFRCGFSEAVKVSLLKDRRFFHQLCQSATRIARRELDVALPAIRASAEWHLRHITQGGDAFEMLEARPLDYGHWSAHKLEPLSNFQLRHGEAVAIGVAIDTVYSSMVHGLLQADAQAVLRCLCDLGFQLDHPLLHKPNDLFAGLEEFRQHLGGRLTLTMLTDVGSPIDVHHIDGHQMCRAIEEVVSFAQAPGQYALA